MDSTNLVQNPGRIQGPVGALYIDNNNYDIHQGVPILFLHSFGGSTEHWQQQLDHVRLHRQAAAFDFRAHGKSEGGKPAEIIRQPLLSS